MPSDWIKSATKNSHGQFRRKAEKHHMTTKSYATKVIRDYKKKDKHSPAQTKTFRQAVLAKNLIKMKK